MARTIHYDDLVLAVEPAPAGGYQVRVLSSPYGPAVAPFPLFAERARMEELIRVARAAVMATPEARHVGALEVENAPERDPREVGDVLFRALFTGAVRETYLLSRGRSEAHADRGLRARLVLPAETADAGLVQALPWELLYCAETREFITRSALTPFVRILPLAWASAPLPAAEARPLRILIAVAAPRDTPILDAGDERARILEALHRQQSAEVEVLQRASLMNLSAALATAHYHVVHFIGHGGFDAAAGEGFLLLEGADGRATAVRGEVLAAVLRASRSLRLVFLNSCKGAEAGRRPDQDPLLATAAALVRGGAPAVIAMQFPISDVAARVFSAAVYLSLARGSSLEAAVGDGRMAIYQASPRSWEWITPVLLAAHAGTEVLRPVCLASADVVARTGEAVVEASRLLRAGSYAAARQAIESRLARGGAEVADLHYYLALALLGGRRPRFLKASELKAIEASARRAIALQDRAAHHLCFLAFLIQDFYLTNHLVPRSPTYEELVDLAGTVPRDAALLAELLLLVPGAEAVATHTDKGVGREE
jgi:hypothetical protein